MKHLVPLAFLLFFSSTVSAKHIIGGVITYRCMGGGTYEFTMKMYRDCTDPTGAGFDFGAPISFYKGDDPNALETIYESPVSIIDIEPDTMNNPCVILPPNTCVEEAIYEWTYTFGEWPSLESYTVSYQRCCRNATITNIQMPGDVGATFTVEILPASQAVCNNSPEYESFPPIVICANEPLELDHSAVDLDGDQLVYELCAPLIGGGQGGGGPGGGNGCNGITPDPACPPPYATVSYIPPYSALSPMAGDPEVTIDPITGLLTGTPEILGQFVVGVCVSEYRNGQLLSVVRRDFQFNIADCQPLVMADIEAPIILPDGTFYFESCNDLEFEIDNISVQAVMVSNFYWEFYVGDSTYVFNKWDPEVVFPEAGTYEGALFLNPGDICGDTGHVIIDIHPELTADFAFDYDTCFSGPVGFIDQSSIAGPGKIVSWDWQFGDSDTSDHPSPVHLYEESGTYFTSLMVVDSFECEAEVTHPVDYRPVPALIIVSPNDVVSCPPAEVFFNNLSAPINSSYDLLWDFGDGNTSEEISPTHVYERDGVYDVFLSITSPIGCYTDTVFQELIEIQPPPVADFICEPGVLSNVEPVGEFLDQSQHAVHWEWYINDNLVAHQQNLTYTFPDTGLQEITLIITHPEKCQDTVSKVIDVVPKWFFHLPNAFTPNEDSVNDIFMGTGLIPGITNFKMQIWDRWGLQVFETTDPYEPWNGLSHNDGRPAAVGVYVVLVSFTGPRGKPFEYQGYATLIR